MDAPATIEEFLEFARSNIDRVTAPEAFAAQQAGALIVDIRPMEQRRRDGAISGALVVDRNVLEWRLAPSSRWCLREATSARLILVCNQGYQSSLAAYTMRRLGLSSTADVIGGFEAWLAAQLPVTGG